MATVEAFDFPVEEIVRAQDNWTTSAPSVRTEDPRDSGAEEFAQLLDEIQPGAGKQLLDSLGGPITITETVSTITVDGIVSSPARAGETYAVTDTSLNVSDAVSEGSSTPTRAVIISHEYREGLVLPTEGPTEAIAIVGEVGQGGQSDELHTTIMARSYEPPANVIVSFGPTGDPEQGAVILDSSVEKQITASPNPRESAAVLAQKAVVNALGFDPATRRLLPGQTAANMLQEPTNGNVRRPAELLATAPRQLAAGVRPARLH